MMKTLLRLLFAGVLLSLLTECCPCRSYQRKTRRPLLATEWQLVQLYGQSIQPEAGKYTITFLAEENRISGSGACNRLSGKFTTDTDRSLRIEPLATTRMTCPEIQQEQKFLDALRSTTHYDMDGPMLMLLSDGELHAVFQAVN